MTRKFTTQEVINMGAELYDNCGFTRETIRIWLKALVDNDCIDREIDFEAIYDLIVG